MEFDGLSILANVTLTSQFPSLFGRSFIDLPSSTANCIVVSSGNGSSGWAPGNLANFSLRIDGSSVLTRETWTRSESVSAAVEFRVDDMPTLRKVRHSCHSHLSPWRPFLLIQNTVRQIAAAAGCSNSMLLSNTHPNIYRRLHGPLISNMRTMRLWALNAISTSQSCLRECRFHGKQSYRVSCYAIHLNITFPV